jgi:hypothetical protein
MDNATRINHSAAVGYRKGSLASGWQVYNVRTALPATAGLYQTLREALLAADELHAACEALAAREG